jgi:transcriptional regulator with XRE-family HTH domain
MADTRIADPTTLGGRLQIAREFAGISARELARLAGVSAVYPSMIESGIRQHIGAEVALRLVSALGLSIGWLINGAGRAPTESSVKAAVTATRKRLANQAA